MGEAAEEAEEPQQALAPWRRPGAREPVLELVEAAERGRAQVQ
jgi:hypothetical protein